MQKSKSWLLHGGTLVTPDLVMDADLLVTGETISAVGHDLPVPEGTEVVDASGLLVLPGVIDAHCHIQLDTGIYKAPDTWWTESQAAARGGVTTVVDFATQFKGQSFQEAVETRLAEAAPSAIDYAFHVMVTDLPAGREDDLGTLIELGTPSIKLYTTYRPNYYADDATLLRLLSAAGRYGLMTLVHCENDSLVTAATQALIEDGRTQLPFHAMARPALAEHEATARVLFLARAAGAPVVIAHNSTSQTVDLIEAARVRGQEVYNETGPQYLLFDDQVYEGSEPWRYILQPPLREPSQPELMWEKVSSGAVNMLITDHCGYTRKQKTAVDDFTKTPGGLPGLETLLPLMATYGVDEGRFEWPDLVAMLSVNPAKIYNLWPRKGAFLPGSDADFVLYDPEPEWMLTEEDVHSAAGYTPFEGMRIKGRVQATVRRGEFLVRDGEFVGKRGSGEFIRREPF